MHFLRRAVARSSPIWAVVSQGCNGVSNILLSLVVARATHPGAYGMWSLGYIAYMVMYSVTRASCSTPILLIGSRRPSAATRNGSAMLAAVIGVVTSIPLLILALIDHQFGTLIWPFLLILSPLSVIDVLRSVAFQSLNNQIAAAIDVTWLILQCLGFITLVVIGRDSAQASTLAWGAAGVVAMTYGLWRLGLHPSPRAAVAFWHSSRSTSWKLVLDDTLVALRTQATPIAVTIFAGFAAAGALRAGLSLMGLLNTVILGLTPIATNYAARRTQAGDGPWGIANRWTQLLLVIAIVNGVALLSIPDHLGRHILGKNWAGADAVILALVVHSCLRGYISGAPIILRARGHLNHALRLRARTEPLALAAPVLGAVAWGARGAAWGYAVGAVSSVALAILAIRWSAHHTVATAPRTTGLPVRGSDSSTRP